MAGRRRWLGLAAVLWAAGCEDQEYGAKKAPAAAEQPGPRAATVVMHGAPGQGLLTPFPSDRYTVADAASPTGKRVRVEAPDDPLFGAFPTFVAPMNRADGFSTVGGVAINFTGDVDPASFSGDVDSFARTDAPLLLVDVDPASPDKGKTRPLVVKYYPTRIEDGNARPDFTLVAQPASPLRPRTAYLFVATTRVRDVSGAAVGPTEAMEALRDGREAGGEYGARLREALGVLKGSVGVGAEQVALATVFTTGSIVDETLAMARQRREAKPPALVGELQVDEVSKSDGRVRFKGRYNAPEFRKAKPDGRWQVEGGAPVVQGQVNLEFLLTVSDQTKAGPRPVVVYGHGLGGDKGGVWGTAQRLSSLGVAVIGIDAPEHGSRSGGSGGQVSSVFDFFALDDKTGVFDLERARDNFRQMASDHLELVRLVQGLGSLDVLPLGAPDGVPDLDPTKMLYIGHSFGSVLASTTMALAPEIEAACLNVGGDGLMTIMRESSTFRLLVKGLQPPSMTDGDMARFFATSQTIIDPGDPINYSRFVGRDAPPGVPGWRPRHALVQEVVGDKIVPNLSTELLARALGAAHVGPTVRPVGAMPLAAAPLSGSPTLAYFQFDRADGKKAEHGELIFTAEARAQYVDFFKGALAGGPRVINPYE